MYNEARPATRPSGGRSRLRSTTQGFENKAALRRRLRRFLAPRAWLCAMLVVPMGVGVRVPADSSSVTGFKVGAGGGTYTIITFAESCEGKQKARWEDHQVGDVGVDVFHRFSDGRAVGLRGGYLEDSSNSSSELEGRYSSGVYWGGPYYEYVKSGARVRIGVVVADGELFSHKRTNVQEFEDRSILPSFGFEAGLSETSYILAGFMDSVPLSAGAVRGGFGIKPWSRADIWLGLTSGPPYGGIGWGTGAEIMATRNLQLSLGFRLGTFEEETEYGGGVALQYLWRHSP